MPIINPNLPNDGEDADALDVSGPILAILAVLNGHLDGDNIEPGSLPWSVMASLNNVIPGSAMADDSNLKKFRDESNLAFVANGLIWSALTGFNGAMTAGVLYSPDGTRTSVSAIASKAFTANKDTYVSVSPGGAVNYQEVTNGSNTPPTLATDYSWLAKVETNGSGVTAVSDLRRLPSAPFKPGYCYHKGYCTVNVQATTNTWVQVTQDVGNQSGDRNIITHGNDVNVTVTIPSSLNANNAEVGFYIAGTYYELSTFSGGQNYAKTYSRTVSVPAGKWPVYAAIKSSGGGTHVVSQFNDVVITAVEVS